MIASKSEILQGTLDLLVLKTLETMGPTHGWGIAKRIEQVSEDALSLNQGTLYPALVRLQQKGWITSAWGTSENNRRAKFYSLTAKGRRRLEVEMESWERMGGHHWEIAADSLKRSLSYVLVSDACRSSSRPVQEEPDR